MTEATLSGRCLCGAVRYEVTGTPLRFLHCHCERCRRASGTGHASNLLVKPGAIDWKGTEPQVQRFKLPEAERFSTAFCKTCGSPLPRGRTELMIIPAGTLDTVPEIKPQGRIFWDSRVPWSCSGDDLPSYAEYPT